MQKKHHPFLALANILIFAAVIVFQTSELCDISIRTASPMLLLPLLCSYAFFSDIKRCAAAGMISGAFIDSVSQGAYCFNTILLMLLAVGVCLAANNLFNKNIFAASVLSLMISLIYYIFLWLFFYLSGNDMESSVEYLLKYAIPSAVYSAVFVFPFYFIYNRFKKIKEH